MSSFPPARLRANLSLRAKSLMVTGIALVPLLLSMGAARGIAGREERAQLLSSQSLQAHYAITLIRDDLEAARNGVMSDLLRRVENLPHSDDRWRRPLTHARAELPGLLSRLDALAGPEAAPLRDLTQRQQNALTTLAQTRARPVTPSEREQLLRRVDTLDDAIVRETARLRSVVTGKMRAQLDALEQERQRRLQLIALTSLAGLTIVFAATLLWTSRLVRRVQGVEANAWRLAHGEELAPDAGRGDEIGRLDWSLHEAAQVLASRSHELFERNRDLRDSEEKFRNAFVNSPFGMSLVAPDGRWLQVNRVLCELLGYAEAELLQISVQDVTPPEDMTRDWEHATELLAGHKASYEMEKRYIHKDGRLTWVHLAVSLARDADGEPMVFVAQVQPIDERRQVEAERERALGALRDSEKRFRAAFVESPMGMALISLDGKWQQVNPAVCHITGYTIPDLLSKRVSDITHPADRNLAADAMRRMVAGEISSYADEKRYLHKEGRLVWVSVSASLVRDGQGKPLHFVGHILDISSRKRAEEQSAQAREALRASEAELRALIEAMNEVVLVLDAEGRHLKVAPSAPNMLPAPPQELCGKTMHDVLPHDQADHAVEAIRRALLQGKPVALEYSLRLPIGEGGREMWFQANISPLDSERVVWVARDITPRREAEVRLRRAKELADSARIDAEFARDEAEAARHESERLRHEAEDARREAEELRAGAERANQAKSDFLSRMSHELRTPLHSILGFSQILEIGQLTSRQSECVGFISTAGRHLLELINEVLDLARVEAGKFDMTLEPLRARDAVSETLSLVRPLAESAGIALHDTLAGESDDESLAICADRQRLRQVLLNLLSNAIKYNRQNGSVTVEARRIGDVHGEGRVRLTVRDTGAGISPEGREKLWLPFERLGADQTNVEGSGLGLALCKNLMEAMGGSIGFESSGVGSAFWIELPAADAAQIPDVVPLSLWGLPSLAVKSEA